MEIKVTVTKDNVAGFERALKSLTKKRVLVGIPDSTASRPDEDGSPLSNAQIGYIQEFGSPAANIPARPHLIPGVENARKPIANRMGAAARKIVDGATDIEQDLVAVGLIAQSSVRNQIRTGSLLPLSERTLQARRARGRFGTLPLIDTSQYLRAITYVIRKT
ncbi:MAG: hypothetical protein E6Q98_16035 [Rhodospirillaceae bacterium]|nr:MAG: hypothetical protein E6Q98_16035 [Rhodospirillaceae bacterium]